MNDRVYEFSVVRKDSVFLKLHYEIYGLTVVWCVDTSHMVAENTGLCRAIRGPSSSYWALV